MKILLAEDDHTIAQSIKKGLTQEHILVDMVYDGKDAYDLATTEPYDCIILDWMLPSEDGLSLCKKLRAEKNHTPILMLTAKSQIPDKVQALENGADDYLTKPFSFEELLARIHALSRRSHPLTPTILSYKNLSLNTHTYEVTRNAHSIQLSAKEFDLLLYFLRNQKKILTKDQIIHHVWDYESSILPNTVEVSIRNLRKKIEAPFPEEKPFITTIRGFGYKFGE